MLNPVLFLAPIMAFAATFLLTKRWIPVAFRIGLVGKDMNKFAKPPVAEMGGIPLISGILGGLLVYIGMNTFFLNQPQYNLDLFAVLSTILIIAFVGMIDDFLGWKVGLSQWQKPILTIPAALPLMVINVGHTSVALPIVGTINLGILYVLLLVPIGIVGASNGFNMLAGYNGLETGMGIIILSAMGFVAYFTGSSWVAMIALCTVAALAAFIYFNWYPAKIFPGNSFTYIIGALIACVAILGNMEKLALILFIPYYMDFIFGSRGKMKVEAFGKVNEDNSLDQPAPKICDVCHLMIAINKKFRKKVYERDVVYSIFAFEIILVLIGVSIYL